jgi:hypothetical protein
MEREKEIFNELKALLANYPEQRVDLEEDQKFTILEGDDEIEYDAEEYEDYDEWYYENWCEESYTVNSIYIDENDELRFDLTKNYSDCNGSDEEDLKNVIIDCICDESDCDLELQMGELMAFINSQKVFKDGVAIIPEGTTEIGKYAFSYCASLKSITIPEGVTEIGEKAFSDCTSLESITIPESVTKIGDLAFVRCASLKSIVVTEGNPAYDSREGCNAIIETGTNTLLAGCETTIIPRTVTKIGRSAFNCITSLESITIPESVTKIGICAFFGCSSLTTVSLPEGVKEIGDNAFYGCSALATIYVPAGKADYYEECLDEDLHDKIVEIEK